MPHTQLQQNYQILFNNYMQLYWPHLKAVKHTTATILEKSKIVALEHVALYVAPIGGATHSSAAILPFLPLLVLF